MSQLIKLLHSSYQVISCSLSSADEVWLKFFKRLALELMLTHLRMPFSAPENTLKSEDSFIFSVTAIDFGNKTTSNNFNILSSHVCLHFDNFKIYRDMSSQKRKSSNINSWIIFYKNRHPLKFKWKNEKNINKQWYYCKEWQEYVSSNVVF